MEKIKIEKQSGVLVATLSTPEKRNVLDEKMIAEITEVFTEESKDKRLKVALIQGEGEIFCAGGDLRWMKEKGELKYDENLADARKLAQMYESIWKFPVPVIVKVQGGAFGGGVGFLAVSDISICEKNAKFRTPEVKIGLIPAVISVFLLRKIGMSNLKFLALTGKEIDAFEAQKIGLINIVCEKDELDKKVNEIIEEIKSNSGYAVRKTKELIMRIFDSSFSYSLDLASHFLAEARAGKDAKEGISAFFEKRKPKFD
jgi:methylglutaconyl-CoA hydratase